MSSRKTVKLLCGIAGGSTALALVVAAAADSRGYFGELRGTAAALRGSGFAVQAAQPAWTPANQPTPTGHSWDFNWDK